MFETLHPEHGWLEQLLGEWSFESEMTLEPGAEPIRTTGTQTVRTLGGFWVLAEPRFRTTGGEEASSVMTLGFDPLHDHALRAALARPRPRRRRLTDRTGGV